MNHPERIFAEQIELIRAIVKRICLRSAMQEPDIEDVISYTFERLIANDYRVFREYRGEKITRSYLELVITNICRDRFRKDSGRWRPSTTALELGELAIRVEELLYRYRYSFNEAVEIIQTEYKNRRQSNPARDDLEEIASILKVKTKTVTFVTEDQHLTKLASVGPEHIDTLRIKELIPLKAQLDKVIQQIKDTLDEEVRFIFNLYFEQGHKITTISRLTGKSRYQIKQILEDNLQRFKQSILDQGFTQNDINEILDYFI
jgi:RNA polymerase sigma factor (sigma-70 family)